MRLFGFAAAIIVAIFILVVAFGSKDSVETPPDYEFGPQALTGVLLKADVSLTRRGTHILVVDGKPTFYVESKSINLTAVEAQTVFIQGMLEPNTRSDDPPVLNAVSAVPAFTNFAMKKHAFEELPILFEAPAHWKASTDGNAVRFRIGSSDETLLLISIIQGSTLPPGETFFVSNKRATRVKEGTSEDVYVSSDDGIVHLHFDAALQGSIDRLEDAIVLEQQFEHVLRSITFVGDEVSSSSENSSPTTAGDVCGGAAAILCPSGFYCDIRDTETGEGICKKY